MREIVIPLDGDFPYPDDVKRIVRILADRGITCSDINARELWARYSDSMAAGWMSTDCEIDEAIYSHIALDVMQFTV